jgi:hypothetical protein
MIIFDIFTVKMSMLVFCTVMPHGLVVTSVLAKHTASIIRAEVVRLYRVQTRTTSEGLLNQNQGPSRGCEHGL